MTIAFTEAIDRKVVAEDTADDLGEVKTFICDVAGKRVTRIQVAGGSRKPQLVDYADISSFGTDVVLVRKATDVHEADDDRTTDMVRGDVEYIGSRILTTDGREDGKVTEVHFDETNGDIIALLGDTIGRVAAEDIRGLGSYAVVVNTQTTR